jgi:DNA-directed RNA polymerase specialized sigma24 family protein
MADIEEPDLSTLISKLLQNNDLKRKFEVYAEKLLRKRTKYDFARHVLPSDIISSVALKLLTGEITWSKETGTLTCFFYRRISTEIFNLAKKEKKFIPVPLEKSAIINDYSGEPEDEVSEPPQFIIYPIGENDEEDEKIDPLEFTEVAYEIFKDSPEEFLVLDGIYNTLQTREIALDLGISKDEVHNIKRRIKRVLKAWINRNKKQKNSTPALALINKNKPLEKPVYENKPGELTPDNNNNGELS